MEFIKATSERKSIDIGLHNFMLNVYKYIGLGLGLTGAISFGITLLPYGIQAIFFGLALFAMLGNLGITLYFNFCGARISSSKAEALFWAYATLMGISLSASLRFYHPESICIAFFVTALTFGATSFYGHVTKRDLTSLGSFCRTGILGLLIALVVCMFFNSHFTYFALSAVGVVLFTCIIAYETQNLRQIYYTTPSDHGTRDKVAILGALSLYTSIINLFLFILRLVGSNDRK